MIYFLILHYFPRMLCEVAQETAAEPPSTSTASSISKPSYVISGPRTGFNGHVVDEHARPFGDLAQKLLRDLLPRIRARMCQVLEVLRFLPFSFDAVQGVLERHLDLRG